MDELVSIIVPVYNAETYLSQTLESIISQSYENIEIIIVNDGSKDKSLDIARSFSKKDKRIKIIDQKNQGVTVARQNGLENAEGQWIFFSDADDLLPYDAIKALLCKSNDVDIVVGSVEFIGNYKWPFVSYDRSYNSNQYLRCLISYKIHGGPYAKLFRKSLFDSNTFNIPREIVLGEDKIMNMNLACNATKGILQVSDIVYTYIQRPTNHPSDIKNRILRLTIECCILKKFSFMLVVLRRFIFVLDETKYFINRILRRK